MKIKISIIILIVCAFIGGMLYHYTYKPPVASSFKVVVSIPPLFMIAREIMQGIDTPYLLIEGAASPHDFALKPSENNKIVNAKIIFWIGKQLEHGLYAPLKRASQKTEVISFMEEGAIKLLPQEGEACSHHSSENHEECEHHPVENQHDPHVWLDPDNAISITEVMRDKLSESDPAHKNLYQKNANNLIAKIRQTTQKLEKDLEPYQSETFIVFHNAYQYFQKRFRLKPPQALTLNPEGSLKIKRLQEIKERIDNNHIKCLFTEPQFPEKLTSTMINHAKVKKGVLNPLGDRTISYVELLEGLGQNIVNCLKE